MGTSTRIGVKSPCIGRCELDARSVCLGCLRHSDEIMAWPQLDDLAKRQILAAADARRAVVSVEPDAEDR
ncbi:MAG: DUF1289 domain-containing protein [Pseudomonadota bacterium]